MCSLIFALFALASPLAAAQDPAPQSTVPVIVTSGEAVVRHTPDRVFVTVAVESRARSPRDAQRQNTEAMTAVQKRIADARVPKDAVRTLGYDLEQEFDFIQGRRIPREFVARNAVEVRLDEIGRTGEIVDAVVQAGATSVSSIRFDLQQRESVEREALRLAVVDARTRAEAAAAGAGRSIDRILRIEDAREGPIVQGRPMMAMARAEAQTLPTPVEPGLIEIRARVTLTVSMK